MSSILNAIRSAPTSTTRGFTSLNIASASPKSAFHPEHHPIVLQQLVQSLGSKPATATSSAASASMAAGSHTFSSSSVASVPESAGQIFAKQFLKV